MTVAKLKTRTMKDLAAMARKKKVAGWHAMRKDELILRSAPEKCLCAHEAKRSEIQRRQSQWFSPLARGSWRGELLTF